MKKQLFKRLLIVVLFIATLQFSACGKKESTNGDNFKPSVSGLTSIEASELAFKTAKNVFKDSVLWRMIPAEEAKSTKMMLDINWSQNDVSSAWFFWYAENNGENWFMIGIKGKEVSYKSIGTRSFSPISINASWPREKLAVSLKEAAAKAASLGAKLETLTWAEYNCDYRASLGGKPEWILSFSEQIGDSALNYTIFIDGITGEAIGALNEKGDKLELPIDREALQKPKQEDHRENILNFFNYINDKNYDFALILLSYNLSPNDTMRNMWLENFKSIKSVKVKSIEQHRLPEWTSSREYYKVVLEVKTDEPEDKYGWANGENTRWITIVPGPGKTWAIDELSTSP